MSLPRILLALGLAALPALAAGRPDRTLPVKPVVPLHGAPAVHKHLHGLGYRARGGVDLASTYQDEVNPKSFPHFSSSFTSGGTTYPFTMVGHPPKSGKSAALRSVLIPLRMNFLYFGDSQDIFVTFHPAPAVKNLAGSPLYVPAGFPNGFGQFGDQMQRAAFWNHMDAGHTWHVTMAPPDVAPVVDIEVTPETGVLYQDDSGHFFGDVLFDFMDSQIQTILQFMNLDADVLPIFVTDDVTAEALGYHNAYATGGGRLQTFLYTSWLDPALVDPLFADVSTFNHELLEWMNDPFVNNVVPTGMYPPATDPTTVCSGNDLLEVGDPQGNGPTYADFPTVPVTLHGITYHLQQLVLWEWFADEPASSAQNGWYTFPAPASLNAPAVSCP